MPLAATCPTTLKYLNTVSATGYQYDYQFTKSVYTFHIRWTDLFRDDCEGSITLHKSTFPEGAI